MQTAQGPDRGTGSGPTDHPADPPTEPVGPPVVAARTTGGDDRTDTTGPGDTPDAPRARRGTGVADMVGFTDDPEKRTRLRRMKAVALSFLLGAAVVWVVFLLWERSGGPAFTGYVRAAAEAGMVGGLADWFAVTALFRHPLGIKIPHTALIPRKKDQLGACLLTSAITVSWLVRTQS